MSEITAQSAYIEFHLYFIIRCIIGDRLSVDWDPHLVQYNSLLLYVAIQAWVPRPTATDIRGWWSLIQKRNELSRDSRQTIKYLARL